MTGRQQQIQEKIEQNRRAQEESLRHREKLIQDLEAARESARREKEESEELKSARKQELEAQVGLSPGTSAQAAGPAGVAALSRHGAQGPLTYFHSLAWTLSRKPTIRSSGHPFLFPTGTLTLLVVGPALLQVLHLPGKQCLLCLPLTSFLVASASTWLSGPKSLLFNSVPNS